MTERKRLAESELPNNDDYGTSSPTKRQRRDISDDPEEKQEAKGHRAPEEGGRESKEPQHAEEKVRETKVDRRPMPMDIVCAIAEYLPPGRARVVEWRCIPTEALDEPQLTAELLAAESDTEGLQHVLCYHKNLDITAIICKAIWAKSDNDLITDLIRTAEVEPDAIFLAAAGAGDHERLAWCMEKKATRHNEALTEATKAGHRDIVTKLLNSEKVTMYRDAILAACRRGDTTLTGQLWYRYKMTKPRGRAHVYYDLEYDLCELAAKKDDIPMLELVGGWAGDIYPRAARSILEGAANRGSLRVLDWMSRAGVKEFGKAYVAAAAAGSVRALIHMKTMPKARGYVGVALVAASFAGKHKALATIYEHLSETFESKSEPAAIGDDFYDVERELNDEHSERDLILDIKVVESRFPPSSDEVRISKVFYIALASPTIDDPDATSPLHDKQSYLQRALMRASAAGKLITTKKLLHLGARMHWKIIANAVKDGKCDLVKYLLGQWVMSDMEFAEVVRVCTAPETAGVYAVALIKAVIDVGRGRELLQRFIDARASTAVCAFVKNVRPADWLTKSGEDFARLVYEFMDSMRMPEEDKTLCGCVTTVLCIPDYDRILKPIYVRILHALFNGLQRTISDICGSGELGEEDANKTIAVLDILIQRVWPIYGCETAKQAVLSRKRPCRHK
jgi:hypothetical protein